MNYLVFNSSSGSNSAARVKRCYCLAAAEPLASEAKAKRTKVKGGLFLHCYVRRVSMTGAIILIADIPLSVSHSFTVARCTGSRGGRSKYRFVAHRNVKCRSTVLAC